MLLTILWLDLARPEACSALLLSIQLCVQRQLLLV